MEEKIFDFTKKQILEAVLERFQGMSKGEKKRNPDLMQQLLSIKESDLHITNIIPIMVSAIIGKNIYYLAISAGLYLGAFLVKESKWKKVVMRIFSIVIAVLNMMFRY